MSGKKIKGSLEDENTYTCIREVTETPDTRLEAISEVN